LSLELECIIFSLYNQLQFSQAVGERTRHVGSRKTLWGRMPFSLYFWTRRIYHEAFLKSF